MKNSEAYEFAEKAIMESKEIKNKFGEITELDLAIFANQRYRTSTKSGIARFTILVTGSKLDGEIKLQLEKQNHQWKIVNQTIIAK